ncbi:MAG: hypothetical protein KBF73_09955 [Flavobacteriales bacterium]|jgi:hypothetical protein|nr:hypothetical protein [Flavobacteriales bacterium]
MRLISLLFLIVCFVTSLNEAFAQSNLIDVVYLKNGSIIKGIIVEQVPGKAIKLETADGSLFVFEFEEITKMTREEASTSSRSFAPPVVNMANSAGLPVDEWGRTHRQNVDISEKSKSVGIAFLTVGGVLIAGGATLLGIGYTRQLRISQEEFYNYIVYGYSAVGTSIPFLSIGGASLAKSKRFKQRAQNMPDGSARISPIIINTERFSQAAVQASYATGIQFSYTF